MLDAVGVIHDRRQASCLGIEVDGHFRHVHGMDVLLSRGEREAQQNASGNQFSIRQRRPRQPAAVAYHHFVHDEHARVGAVFGDHVLEVARASSAAVQAPRTEWEHVVVDGFG